MANAFSWCRTNRNDIYLSWSGDLKQFQIEATATDPDDGAFYHRYRRQHEE